MNKKAISTILAVSVLGSLTVLGGCDGDRSVETSSATAVEETTSKEVIEDDTKTDETYVPGSVHSDPDDFKCQTIKDYIEENKDNQNIIMESKLGEYAASFDNTAVGVEEVLIASDFEKSEKTMFIKFDTFENAKAYLGDELVGQELEKTENSDGSIDYETKGDENKMYGKVYADGLMTWVMKIH